jgi:hypothetical protein
MGKHGQTGTELVNTNIGAGNKSERPSAEGKVKLSTSTKYPRKFGTQLSISGILVSLPKTKKIKI